jgi:hypothetical protein
MQKNKLIRALILYKSIDISADQIQRECNALLDGMSRKAQRVLLEQSSNKIPEIAQSVGIMICLPSGEPLPIAQLYMKRAKEILSERLLYLSNFKSWLQDLELFLNSFHSFFLQKFDYEPKTEWQQLYQVAFSNIPPAERNDLAEQFSKLVIHLL